MYRAASIYFDKSFEKYDDALEYARLNACAVYDSDDNLIDDYREYDYYEMTQGGAVEW